jgi:hypothetical protein
MFAKSREKSETIRFRILELNVKRYKAVIKINPT